MDTPRVRVIIVTQDGKELEHVLTMKQWGRMISDHERQSKHRDVQRAYMRERRATCEGKGKEKEDLDLSALAVEARTLGILPAPRAIRGRA